MATYDDVERLALTLPETTSASSYNAPALKVNNKLVARLRVESADQIDDRTGQPFGEVLMLKVADLGEKEALLASGPEVFFTTPHYDGYAAVLVRLAAISDAELQELLTEAWLRVAPKRAVKSYVTQHGALPGSEGGV